ncbi:MULTISPECIES: type II toxin-antitoxin system RelE/ParE family toxin [unclassified Methylophilus]|jgi:plasmid stabilization system protein ParE|uniref:type II toxin-antitoxin system RelE/ParE family toxin n=1 Tax=unclassified Methylophilus TaxID=2630143 RepID=UPI0004B2C8C8|nr:MULTISPECIES: type II toxin-antitoxin system RelE/ParE family toxin [unclassified Methylophilus]
MYRIRFTKEAREDLKRLYAFLLNKDRQAARQALKAIHQAIEAVKFFPYTCRKALGDNPFLRELVIHFGAYGYVALFEIEDNQTITIVAVRHQREEDFF